MLRRVVSGLTQQARWNVHPSLALVSVRGLKETTGIVGVNVDPEARAHLKEKLNEVLEAIKVVPEDAGYRKAVEAAFQSRLDAVNSAAEDEEIEKQFSTQLEMMIKEVNDELSLIPVMTEWKPWVVPEGHKIKIEEEVDIPEPEKAA